MKKSILFSIIFCLGFTNLFAIEFNRYKYNFNHDWKVIVADIDIKKLELYLNNSKSVTLPYAWNEDDAFKKDITELSTGIAWYIKYFNLPADHKGMKVFIEFEGVRQSAEVFVNGRFVGKHENGVTAFGFDISDLVFFGKKENLITIKTDNSWDYLEKSTNTSFQWNDKNFNANYGGIPKNVILHVTGKVYQTLPLYSNLKTAGQYIYASEINIAKKSAVISIESEVKNERDETVDLVLEVELEDMDGKK